MSKYEEKIWKNPCPWDFCKQNKELRHIFGAIALFSKSLIHLPDQWCIHSLIKYSLSGYGVPNIVFIRKPAHGRGRENNMEWNESKDTSVNHPFAFFLGVRRLKHLANRRKNNKTGSLWKWFIKVIHDLCTEKQVLKDYRKQRRNDQNRCVCSQLAKGKQGELQSGETMPRTVLGRIK